MRIVCARQKRAEWCKREANRCKSETVWCAGTLLLVEFDTIQPGDGNPLVSGPSRMREQMSVPFAEDLIYERLLVSLQSPEISDVEKSRFEALLLLADFSIRLL